MRDRAAGTARSRLARVHLSTSKNTKLQLTSLAGRAILSYCPSTLQRRNERPKERGERARKAIAAATTPTISVPFVAGMLTDPSTGARTRRYLDGSDGSAGKSSGRACTPRQLRGPGSVRDGNLWRELLELPATGDSYSDYSSRKGEGKEMSGH